MFKKFWEFVKIKREAKATKNFIKNFNSEEKAFEKLEEYYTQHKDTSVKLITKEVEEYYKYYDMASDKLETLIKVTADKFKGMDTENIYHQIRIQLMANEKNLSFVGSSFTIVTFITIIIASLFLNAIINFNNSQSIISHVFLYLLERGISIFIAIIIICLLLLIFIFLIISPFVAFLGVLQKFDKPTRKNIKINTIKLELIKDKINKLEKSKSQKHEDS